MPGLRWAGDHGRGRRGGEGNGAGALTLPTAGPAFSCLQTPTARWSSGCSLLCIKRRGLRRTLTAVLVATLPRALSPASG